MAVARDADTPPRHAGRTAKKVAEAAKTGKLIDLNAKDRKALRPGQRAKVRKQRKSTAPTFTEAEELQNRADKIIGQDVWRLRALAQAKVLYLFSTAERITGCLDGTLRAGRYPRMFRYKAGLRYDFLVLVSKPRWERAEDAERTRIAYHGLRHLGSDTAGRWRTEGHEIDGFFSEVEFFGLKDPSLNKIHQLLLEFGHGG